MPVLFSIIVVAAMIYALVDIIRRDEWQVRSLPKTMWIIIVILLPLIGTVLWFTLGRVYEDRPRKQPRFTMPAPAPTARPQQRSTEQQLADLEREIEEDRLRRELDRKRREAGGAEA